MDFKNRVKVMALFAGDIVALYLGLFATLILRYGANFYALFVALHVLPFSIIFLFWIIIFYVAGLYDIRHLRNNLDFLKIFGLTLTVNAIVAVFFFYLIPAFGITPKTNLFVFIVIFAIIEFYWRRAFNRVISHGEAPNKVLLIGSGRAAHATQRSVIENPQLGYEIKAHLMEEEVYAEPKRLYDLSMQHHVNLVVVPRELKHDEKLNKALYDLLGQGIEIRDVINFHELIMRKVPVSDLEESWFLENLINQQKFYDQLKRAWEFLAALAIGIVLLPVELLIALIVKLTSPGPVFIRQKRVGRLGATFTLYKFRSMVALSPEGLAETNGAQWAARGDARVTPFGRFIRAAHLDELPQLMNIVRGDLSFVGPRPERPEFIQILKEKIPYYEIRQLLKPGVTGWAQINYRYGASIEDSQKKLEYDIYYIKNRSIMLDIAIILKTIKSLFVNQK